MDCLMAKCEPLNGPLLRRRLIPRRHIETLSADHTCFTGIPTITDCVLAELEKLGPKYRLALRSVFRRKLDPSWVIASFTRRRLMPSSPFGLNLFFSIVVT